MIESLNLKILDTGAEMSIEKILIVEDDSNWSELAKYILEQNGYNAIVAKTSEDAQKALLRKTFSLILMDIHVGQSDGIQLVKWMKYREELQDIPVIMVTSDQMRDTFYRAVDVNIHDYLLKPYEPNTLLKKTTAALANSNSEKTTLDDLSQNNTIDPNNSELNSVFNYDSLLYRCMWDQKQAKYTIKKFQERVVRDIEQFEASTNLEELAYLAHSLKGAAAFVSAPTIQDLAGYLEKDVVENKLNSACEYIPLFRNELNRFSKYVESILNNKTELELNA